MFWWQTPAFAGQEPRTGGPYWDIVHLPSSAILAQANFAEEGRNQKFVLSFPVVFHPAMGPSAALFFLRRTGVSSRRCLRTQQPKVGRYTLRRFSEPNGYNWANWRVKVVQTLSRMRGSYPHCMQHRVSGVIRPTRSCMRSRGEKFSSSFQPP